MANYNAEVYVYSKWMFSFSEWHYMYCVYEDYRVVCNWKAADSSGGREGELLPDPSSKATCALNPACLEKGLHRSVHRIHLINQEQKITVTLTRVNNH